MSSLKDIRFDVLSETVPSGTYHLQDSLFIQTGSSFLFTSSFISCELLGEVRSTEHTNSGRLAGGVLGLAVAGPLGALAGLMTGGKLTVDETEFFCELDDGRSFVAKCNGAAYTKFKAAVAVNNAERRRDAIVAASASTVVIAQQLEATKELSQAVPDTCQKDCPSCAESVKFRARNCRYCGHKFDLVMGQKFGNGFSDFKEYFVTYPFESEPVGISDQDLAITFYIFRAVENQFKHISKKYTLQELKDIPAYEWGDGYIEEEKTPDEYYVRLSEIEDNYIGSLINRLALRDDNPDDPDRDAEVYVCVIEAIEEYHRRFD